MARIRSIFLISALLLLVFLITSYLLVLGIHKLGPPFWTQEAAGWLQAFGSIVAILVAVAVAWYQNVSQRNHDNHRERQDERAMLRCLRTDIKTHLAAVATNFAPAIDQTPDGPVRSIFPLTDDPFTIYTAFLPKLGLIENDDLRIEIVEAYATAKSFVQTVRFNNRLIEALQDATKEFQRYNSEGVHQGLKDANAALIAYGPMVRQIHREAVKKGSELMLKLGAY